MSVKVIRDENGTLHRVPASQPYTTPKGRKLAGRPHVDVWWDRDPIHKADEDLIIRQENGSLGPNGKPRADVIVVTQAQAYDIMQAVAFTVLKP